MLSSSYIFNGKPLILNSEQKKNIIQQTQSFRFFQSLIRHQYLHQSQQNIYIRKYMDSHCLLSSINSSKNKQNTQNSTQSTMKINPLREFFKKHNQPECKTMSNLNSSNALPHLTVNQNKQKKRMMTSIQLRQEVDKAQNKKEKRSSNGTEEKQQQLKQRINFEIDKIVEEEQKDFELQRNQYKKISFHNHKVNMSELIVIKEASIKQFYELQERIGEGTYGQVFKAKCKVTNELRAIKIIKKRLMNQGKVKQFLAETSLLKKISHPSIIRVFDLYHHQNSYYVVMQYCAGGSIAESLDKIVFKSPKIVANVMKQVLGALSYLHSLSIVHRDIKIQNIVFLNKVTNENIDDFMPVKIIDFGTALEMQYKIQHNIAIAGTINYMAPEVFKGILTEKSDIWSCAVMTIQMLTGANPLLGINEKETIKNIDSKILNFYEKPFSLVSLEARDLLQKMFERSYHKRPSASELIKHPFFKDVKNKSLTSMTNLMELQNCQNKNQLVSVIECFLTLKKMSQEEEQRLAKIFTQMDKDCSGQIEKTQFMDIYRSLSPATDEEELRGIIDQIDKDKSGKIDFNQFLVAMSGRKQLQMKESLSQAFDFFDKDTTGFLEKKELRTILKNSPKKEVQVFLELIDTDKDNVISKEQFINYLSTFS